jgi:hypothetical protein
MPPLTKKQRQARDQRASRARNFTSGLIGDYKTTDLNYQPDSEEEATDSDVSVQEISFDREVELALHGCLYVCLLAPL